MRRLIISRLIWIYTVCASSVLVCKAEKVKLFPNLLKPNSAVETLGLELR